MTLFVGGLVVGFAIGWALYWYLAQVERPGFPRFRVGNWRTMIRRTKRWTPVETIPPARPMAASPPAATVTLVAEENPRSAPALESAAAENAPVVAYCARCRKKQVMKAPEPVEASDGRPAYRGTCEACGARVFAFRS